MPLIRFDSYLIRDRIFFLENETALPLIWGAGGANNPSQLVRQAKELYQAQQYQSALPLWNLAVIGYARSGDRINQAIALSNLSLTHQQLGQWEAASRAIASNLELLPEDDSLVLAQTLDIQGKLQRETGKSAAAVETWQQAADIYQKQQNTAALSQNNLNQAHALQDLGLYSRACKRLLYTVSLEGVSTCKQLNQLREAELQTKLKPLTSKPSVTTVSALRSLGDLLIATGQPLQSEQILAASLSSAQKLDLPVEIATTYLSQGNTYKALANGEDIATQRRRYEKQTIEAYSQATSIAPSSTIELKARLNELNFSIQKEKWAEAETLWRSLYPEITNASPLNSRDNLYARINYGQNLVKLIALDDPTIPTPSLDEARQVLTSAAEGAKTLGDNRIAAYAWGSLGRLNEVVEEYPTAEIYTKQALNLISNYDAADIAYQYFWQLGRIQRQQENIPDAIASYTKAYNALQSLRSDIATIII